MNSLFSLKANEKQKKAMKLFEKILEELLADVYKQGVEHGRVFLSKGSELKQEEKKKIIAIATWREKDRILQAINSK